MMARANFESIEREAKEKCAKAPSSPAKKEYDAVNAPAHYTEGRKYQPIDVIQDWELDFCLGNTVKYISRAGRKKSAAMSDLDKEIQDLKKAEFYLNYKIKELESQNTIVDTGYQE